MSIINFNSLPEDQFTQSFLPDGENIFTGDTTFRWSIHTQPEGKISDWTSFLPPLPLEDYKKYFLPKGSNVLIVGDIETSDEDSRLLFNSGDFSPFDFWDTATVGDFAFYQLKVSETIDGNIGALPSFAELYGQEVLEDLDFIGRSLKTTRDNLFEAAENASEATAKSAKNFGTFLTLIGITVAGALFIRLGGGKIFSDISKARRKK